MSTENKKYENEVNHFLAFMNSCIKYLCKNAVRKIHGCNAGKNDIPLDDLTEKETEKYLSFEEEYEHLEGGRYKVKINNVELDVDSKLLKEVLERVMPEREAKALIVTIGWEYSNNEAATLLNVTSKSIKKYKCDGLRKARGVVRKYEDKQEKAE